MELAVIGGTFDSKNGKKSAIVEQVSKYASEYATVCTTNGGNLTHLRSWINNNGLTHAQAALWMPNIDNSEDKILPVIKKRYPHLILVQSKRSVEKEYNYFDVISRMLDSHAALGLIVSRPNGSLVFSLVDPLGNIYAENASLQEMCRALMIRLLKISRMTRQRSEKIGDRIDFEVEEDFLKAAKFLGSEFTKYVTAVNPNRFLGNVSTRCCYGFPSARSKCGTIYISKRNVDKTIINSNQFVEVNRIGLEGNVVGYRGHLKPSVDTPIQLKLYDIYQNVNYMVHGHVYVGGAPFTKTSIPCGFLEEAEEVVQAIPDKNVSNVVVNLVGHGCLMMAKDISYFYDHEFISRPTIEPGR